MSQILQLTGTRDRGGCLHVVLPCADYSGWENGGLGVLKRRAVVQKKSSLNEVVFGRRREPGTENVMILAGGKILAVGEDAEDQTAAWSLMLGATQRPWLVVPERGAGAQRHGRSWRDLLPGHSVPAATSLRDFQTSRAGEEWASEYVRSSSRIKPRIFVDSWIPPNNQLPYGLWLTPSRP